MDASRSLFCGIQRKAHGAQQPRHIMWLLRHVTGEASSLRELAAAIPAPDAYAHRVMATGENVSTMQRSDEPAKWIYGGIL